MLIQTFDGCLLEVATEQEKPSVLCGYEIDRP